MYKTGEKKLTEGNKGREDFNRSRVAATDLGLRGEAGGFRFGAQGDYGEKR